MPNNLTFTDPITITDLRRARILSIGKIDIDGAEMHVEIEFRNTGTVAYPQRWMLSIKNGSADALIARAAIIPALAAPATLLDWVVPTTLTGAGLATAFDQCLTAFRNTGNPRSNVLTILQGLSGNLPAELGGGVATVLPGGAVS